MDLELKTKWVAALRSGKYRQGKGLLHSASGRKCCLGVLCVVAGLKGVKVGGCFAYDDETQDLSKYLLKEFGLNIEVMTTLENMNDMGNSFKDIAKYIEEDTGL